ncbi:MAG: iron ABC transporter permease [Aigarchaeota archaeon]|nr:iron ABC transporter permease [Aigarchaeota archaeon]MDW8092899.1 iron ABC transporter permease [Nitrososphaerota archaeon]
MSSNRLTVTIVLAGIQPLVIIWALVMGSVDVTLGQLLEILRVGPTGDIASRVVWEIRLPRTLGAWLGGCSLAIAGIMLQVYFRNPLADPYILGISAGSSLMVALVIFGGFTLGIMTSPYDPYALFMGSLAGALMASVLIVSISIVTNRHTVILLAGLLFSYLAYSITTIVQYLVDIERFRAYVFWMFGSFGGVKWSLLIPASIAMIAASLLSIALAKPLNALLMGEDYARSMGVNIRVTRISLILFSSLMASSVTLLAGPVGFIGIAVPYVSRSILRTSDNRYLIPFSALAGSTITVSADVLARTVISPVELPISAITAMIGVPLIIALLLKERGI